jgi:hypothetical protein
MEEDNRNYIHNKNISQETIDITNKIKKNDDPYPFYSLDKIKEILIQSGEFDIELINKIIKNESILELEKYMNSIKKKTKNNCASNQKDNCLKKKRDRKTYKIGDVWTHNMIRKIKFKLVDYCFKLINKMIYKNEEEGIKFLRMCPEIIFCSNSEKNLDLCEKPLKDLFSFDISIKYKSISKDYNAKLINQIVEHKIEFEDYDTIMFLFKITLNDWIDLFTFKKDLFTLVKEYNAVNVNYTKIRNNYIGVNDLLNNLSKINESNEYFSLFLLCVFNLQRWFYIKKMKKLAKKEK